MKIRFLGAVGTVTGSMYLLQIGRHNLLLECGLYQGKRQEYFERNRKFPFEIRRLDAVVLSHAHIDHSGNLPNLVAQGFNGSIYATRATVDLCGAMLPDSGRIQEQDIAYANKKRARQGLPPMEPLYTEEDALQTLGHFVGWSYNRPQEIMRGVQLTFLDAGHILGSACVLLEVQEKRGRPLRFLFSGDLGRCGLPIIRDPMLLPETDYLMLESTYGDRLHEPVAAMQEQLADIVNKVAARGGRIVIPAFAVGRTQEIVYDLHQLIHAGRIPELPIYVDSPLALNATEVFRQHPEYYDRETLDFLTQSGEKDAFGFFRLNYVRTREESQALNEAANPMIIISASGMAEAGRVQHHLKHAITDPRNAVLITGWQAPNTLGRRIADREPFVRIYGEEFPLRAEVYELYGYSAHADRNDLLRWAAPQSQRVRAAFVVHGEPESAQALAQGLRDEGYRQVVVPTLGEKVTLGET